ncbi:MAG: ADP-ribosylglycohydrolase family protein [Nitrospiraceae bacterium]|nr:MAG: ADP-ribosylglycohydrolase family protein [Nitrospiraceae bacterium]
MTVPRKEQFSGCIIGQCLGDALGFPVEGYPHEVCDQYVRTILREGRAGEKTRGFYPFGQYTDDSQLARELMMSYSSCQGFSPDDYAKRITVIFQDERVVGRGRATEEAAQRLTRGVHWEESGTPSPSAGNGSAMRAGPVGLFFYDDPQKLIQAAHDQGRITHQDKRCSAGSVAIAGAVALALQQQPLDKQNFIEKLSMWTRTIDESTASHIQKLIQWILLSPEQAVHYISRAGLSHDYTDGWKGISPFVTGSVLWSLYSFLRTPDDYWQTVCTAIAVGGDVDTTAAMAGAVSGAYLGVEELPMHLSHRLTDQGGWGYDELVTLANTCHEIKMKQLKQ